MINTIKLKHNLIFLNYLLDQCYVFNSINKYLISNIKTVLQYFFGNSKTIHEMSFVKTKTKNTLKTYTSFIK